MKQQPFDPNQTRHQLKRSSVEQSIYDGNGFRKPLAHQESVFMLDKTDYMSSSGSFGSNTEGDRYQQRRKSILKDQSTNNQISRSGQNRASRPAYSGDTGIPSSDCNSSSSSGRSSDDSNRNLNNYHKRNYRCNNSGGYRSQQPRTAKYYLDHHYQY